MSLSKQIVFSAVCVSLSYIPGAVCAQNDAVIGKPASVSEYWDQGKKHATAAEGFEAKRQFKEALEKYQDALTAFRSVQVKDPAWNTDGVESRIGFCQRRLTAVQRYINETQGELITPSASPAAVHQPVAPAPILTPSANAGATPPLRTTLSPAPSANSGGGGIAGEVARMEQEINALRTFNNQLSMELAQLRGQLKNLEGKPDQQTQIAKLSAERDDAQTKLLDAESRAKVLSSMYEKSNERSAENSLLFKEASAKLTRTESVLKSVQEELTANKTELEKLQKSLAELGSKASASEKLTAELSAKLKTAEENGQKSVSEVKRLQESLENTAQTAADNAAKLKADADQKLADARNAKIQIEKNLAELNAKLSEHTRLSTEQNTKLENLEKTRQTLQTSLEQAQSRTAELEKQLTDLKNASAESQNRLIAEKKSVEEQLAAAQKTVENAVNAKTDAERKCAELTQSTDAAQKRTTELQTQLQTLEKNLKDQEGSARSTLDNYAAVERKLIESNQLLEAEKTQSSERQNRLAVLEKELTAQTAAVAQALEAKTAAEKKLSENTMNFMAERTELNLTVDNTAKLAEQWKRQYESLKETSANLGELAEQNAKLTAECDQFKTRIEQLSIQTLSPDSAVAKLNADLAVARHEKEVLQKTLSASADEIDSLSTQIAALRKDVSAAPASPMKINELESKITLLTQTLAQTVGERDKLAAVKTSLDKEIAELRQKAAPAPADLNDQLKRKNDAIDTLMKERADLSRKVMELQADNERLRGVRP